MVRKRARSARLPNVPEDTPMPKRFLEAGKIVGTHGIRGDRTVQSWCDSPEVLCDFDTLYLD